MGALKIVAGKVKVDRNKCNNCGVCIRAECDFNAVSCEKQGFKVFIGGKWGRNVRRGDMLPGIYSKNEALSIIEKAILFFGDNANTKERFGDMIDRIGADDVINQLLHSEKVTGWLSKNN